MLNLKFPLALKLLLLLILSAPVQGTEQPVIAIIGALKAKPFQQTIKSFQQSVREAYPDITFIEPDSEKQPDSVPAQALLFTLGSRALAHAIDIQQSRNIVACMLLNTRILKEQSNFAAIVLKTSVLKQLQWHKQFLPEKKRIGILYNPARHKPWIDEARKLAPKLKLEIVAIPVKSAKQLPKALKLLGRKADTLLGIPDKTIYSGKTAKSILLFSFRNRIPFIGLSSAWVKAGALYALDWDYSKLGQDCASLALKMLNDKKANKLPMRSLNQQIYIINLKTEKRMKLNLSKRLINGAFKVYR